MHLSEWKYQWAWNETNEKYQWAWKLSAMCNIAAVLICMSYLLIFSSNPPNKCFWVPLFLLKLWLTVWRFITTDPAHHLHPSSLVSLKLCLAPVISSWCRKISSFPQRVCIVVRVNNCSSELPTGGFHRVSYLRVDFKSIYFPLLPFPPHLLLSHFVLLLKHFRSVSACGCYYRADVHWLRVWMKSKPDNLCKVIRPN